MQQCESKNIVKMLGFEEDADFYYLFCEFCNEGDLFNLQGRQ